MSKKSRCVVIGGSSGMGFAVAAKLQKAGHEVVIASRNKEKLERAKEQLGTVEAHPLDITSEEVVKAFFLKIGAFDHLIITAADFIMGSFTELETSQARAFFDSKFWGQYIAAKYAVPFLRERGSITFFGGIAGQKPLEHFACGAAINAAIEGLTRALAVELGPVRVNAVAPGTVETPIWNSVPQKERTKIFQATANKLPVKRIGQPEDIAEAVLFLIMCGFTTGSVLYVDGGALMT